MPNDLKPQTSISSREVATERYVPSFQPDPMPPLEATSSTKEESSSSNESWELDSEGGGEGFVVFGDKTVATEMGTAGRDGVGDVGEISVSIAGTALDEGTELVFAKPSPKGLLATTAAMLAWALATAADALFKLLIINKASSGETKPSSLTSKYGGGAALPVAGTGNFPEESL
jgi:hypothetical protein